MAKTGYINGSDLLIKIAGKPVGHSTSHSLSLSSETKDRAVKPLATTTISDSKWKEKGVSGLSASISAEGLRVFSETEGGYKSLLAAWLRGEPVEVEAYERSAASGEDPTPYLSGPFVITSLQESAAANDDATYSVQLENAGALTIAPASLTGETIASE